MGKPVSSSVERVETTALNTKINRELFTKFKDCCAYYGYPMNVIIETFMQQYTNGRFNLSHEDILKWKGIEYEEDALNTTFNKEIYHNFKTKCKSNGYFVRHVLMAFMEKYATKNLVLEYVWQEKCNK